MKNIYLIGPRASGKTTVGKALAEHLEKSFADTDHMFVEKFDTSIADCVKKDGWDAFRRRESDILRSLAAKSDMVVSCGGGIVLRDANRKLLSSGLTVYLNVSPEVLAERLANDPQDGQRPSLTGRSVADEIRDVLTMRDPMYRECAHLVMEQGKIEVLVRRIAAAADRLSEKS